MGKPRRTFRVVRTLSEERISPLAREEAQELLAELIARAYAADHPQLFLADSHLTEGRDVAQPPSTVATGGSSPLGRAAGHVRSEDHERGTNTT